MNYIAIEWDSEEKLWVVKCLGNELSGLSEHKRLCDAFRLFSAWVELGGGKITLIDE